MCYACIKGGGHRRSDTLYAPNSIVSSIASRIINVGTLLDRELVKKREGDLLVQRQQ